MKKFGKLITVFLLCATIFAAFSATAFAESTAFEIEALHMSISIPNDMMTITRESAKTDSYFSKFGLNYKETMENCKEGNIYLQSMKKNSSLTLTVTMTENAYTRSAGSYSSMDDEKLSAVMGELLQDKSNKSASISEHNGVKYIYLATTVKSDDKIVQARQYNTVINGQNIIITLQAAAGKKFTADNEALFTEIIDQTTILEQNVFSGNANLWLYIGVTLIGVLLVAGVLVFLIKFFKTPERRHKHLVHELAHERKITNTTKIPRDGVYDDFKRDDIPERHERETIASEYTTAKRTVVPGDELESLDEVLGGMNAFDEPDELEALADQPAEPEYAKPYEEEDEIIAAEETPEEDDALEQFDEEELEEYEPEDELEQTVEIKPMQPLNTERIDSAAIEEALEKSGLESKAEFGESGYYDVDEPAVSERFRSAISNVRRSTYAYDDEENYDEGPSQSFADNARKGLSATGRVLKVIGRGLLKVLAAIWTVIVFIAVHCRYFCINLYRTVKRNRAIKKRRRAEEERRRQESERRRAQRDAERVRRMENAHRGENDLVKVHSSAERPVRRPAPDRRNTNNRPRSGRPSGRPQGRPTGRR